MEIHLIYAESIYSSVLRNHTISDPERPLGMSGAISFYRWGREREGCV